MLMIIVLLSLGIVAINSVCIPKEKYTAICIGQDYDSILNYTSSISNSVPFCLMSYTALKSDAGTLKGLYDPINYGSGIEWASGLMEKYPNRHLQLGLYLVDQLDSILAGFLDREIDELAEYIDDITYNSKSRIYLRIGYEFDNPSNNYHYLSYCRAFRYIVRRFRLKSIDTVAFVWHSYGNVMHNNMKLIDYYPGDSYVDWCGISIFEQPYGCQSSLTCIMPDLERVVKFCNDRKKPVMIAESTPFGGILQYDNPKKVNEAGVSGSTWNRWFEVVLFFIDKYDIRMWSYINCDWDSQPMWNSTDNRAPGIHWGDSRIEKYSDILSRWTDQVINNEKFNFNINDDKSEDDVCIEDNESNNNDDYFDDDYIDIPKHSTITYWLKFLLKLFAFSLLIWFIYFFYNTRYGNGSLLMRSMTTDSSGYTVIG